MATADETTQREAAKLALLQRISDLAPEAQNRAQGEAIRDLAEAYAWVAAPNQAHGGHTSNRS